MNRAQWFQFWRIMLAMARWIRSGNPDDLDRFNSVVKDYAPEE